MDGQKYTHHTDVVAIQRCLVQLGLLLPLRGSLAIKMTPSARTKKKRKVRCDYKKCGLLADRN